MIANAWSRLVRWLAREEFAYLEHENRELRYEGECWRHRYEGAIDAVRVFEARYNFMQNAIADAAMSKPPAIVIKSEGSTGGRK
jgi:hypothetical protein